MPLSDEWGPGKWRSSSQRKPRSSSVGLSALSLVPGHPYRASSLLWAFALFWLALFLSALNVSISAIRAINGGFE
jgi:hypothetical protein